MLLMCRHSHVCHFRNLFLMFFWCFLVFFMFEIKKYSCNLSFFFTKKIENAMAIAIQNATVIQIAIAIVIALAMTKCVKNGNKCKFWFVQTSKCSIFNFQF